MVRGYRTPEDKPQSHRDTETGERTEPPARTGTSTRNEERRNEERAIAVAVIGRTERRPRSVHSPGDARSRSEGAKTGHPFEGKRPNVRRGVRPLSPTPRSASTVAI